MENKKYYVAKPDLTPYEGVKVTKDLNLTFENEKVKQEIKNLKLNSTFIYENEKYKTTNILEINLEEGEILLLEEENRGYFLPMDIGVEPIERAIEDYEALNLALRGDGNNENDTTRNEETSS